MSLSQSIPATVQPLPIQEVSTTIDPETMHVQVSLRSVVSELVRLVRYAHISAQGVARCPEHSQLVLVELLRELEAAKTLANLLDTDVPYGRS